MQTIQQGLEQEGLHIAINLKHDKPNEWNLFKNNGNISLTIDKSMLPYFAQALEVEVEKVIFVAKKTVNLDSFDVNVAGVANTLSKIANLPLFKGENTNIKMGFPFNLSISEDDKESLEELVMMVKYIFVT